MAASIWPRTPNREGSAELVSSGGVLTHDIATLRSPLSGTQLLVTQNPINLNANRRHTAQTLAVAGKPYWVLAILATALGAQSLPPITSQNSCAVPLSPVDVSRPAAVVGTGTPQSCTEVGLQSAMSGGGVIVFNCGPNPVVIPITTEHPFRNDTNTVLDGGNRITLRGNGATRIFVARSGDPPLYGGTPPYYKSTRTSVTLQNITITNGRSSGPSLPPLPPGAPANCSQGTEFEGSGGVIYVRDMVLHVINAKFQSNHGPVLGPDVAGGAIYALGSLDVTVVGSTFQSNDASNGGALGGLQSNVTLVNNLFHDNRSVGLGGNYNIQSSGCPLHLNQYQVGSGGNGGAIYFDGQADRGVVVCGNQFRRNSGTDALGGAVWGAGDPGTLSLTIGQSEFENNRNAKGGAVYGYKTRLVIVSSTFANNSASYGGAIQADLTQFVGANNTFSGNRAAVAVGTLALFGTSNGVILNSTFTGNSAPYFPILFHGDTSTPAPNLVVSNNLFQQNVATAYSIPCRSTISGRNNIVWPAVSSNPASEAGCAAGTITINPLLGTLADNGGGLLTIAVPTTSPAARFANANCPATDARGLTRGSPCAAGAFEPK